LLAGDYARVKVGGKIIRRSLETSVWTTAKLKLLDFLREQRHECSAGLAPSFKEALAAYEQELDADPSVKPQSKEYRRWCIRKIQSRPAPSFCHALH
jgi:hypothetical protein